MPTFFGYDERQRVQRRRFENIKNKPYEGLMTNGNFGIPKKYKSFQVDQRSELWGRVMQVPSLTEYGQALAGDLFVGSYYKQTLEDIAQKVNRTEVPFDREILKEAVYQAAN